MTIHRARLYGVMHAASFPGRRRAYQRLTAVSGARPGDRVLDVGCGTGYFARQVAEAVGPEGSVLGVDAAPEMVDYANRATRGLRQLRCQVGLAESLDLPSEHFDVVVSSLMMHHLPADLRLPALREMRRVLRPGGRLLVADFRPPTGRLASWVTGVFSSPAMRHNDLVALRVAIDDAGFTVTTTGNANRWLRYIAARRTD